MPVTLLGDALVFPDPAGAEPDGLLAIGGDLRTDRLRLAYRSGIFPWYSEGWPIAWYSPDPRLVMTPDGVRVNKSLRRLLRTAPTRLTFDAAFPEVIDRCARIDRAHEEGTWITEEMKHAYIALHREGDAHSVEVWQADTLVGGLYGVAVGTCFAGESMFASTTGASKIAFVGLARFLSRWGFSLIDCQLPTPHLERLGGVPMSRARFLAALAGAVASAPREHAWRVDTPITGADLAT